MTTRIAGIDAKKGRISTFQVETPLITDHQISHEKSSNAELNVLGQSEEQLKLHKFEEALKSIRQAVEISPDCPLILKRAGQVYEGLENYVEAIKFYERLKERTTIHGNSKCYTVEKDVDLTYLDQRIKAVTLKKTFKSLTQSLTSVVTKPKSNSELTIVKMESSQSNHVSMGNFYRDQMNYVEAIKYYSKAEDDVEAELNLGIFLLMGRGCEENSQEAVKLISSAAQKNLYHANEGVVNRKVYDARCIMDIFAKEGLGEYSRFGPVKDWIKHRRRNILGMGTDKLFSDIATTSYNIKLSGTQLSPETLKLIVDDALKLQKKEDFENSLVLLKTVFRLDYCPKDLMFWIKIVQSKLAIFKFTKRLPIIGDCKVFFRNDTIDREFFSCFLSTNGNQNGEHQKALELYKTVHKTSLIIVVAEFLFEIEADIGLFEKSIIDILRTSSEEWRNNANEDANNYMEIEVRRILEIIKLINC